MTQYTNQLDKLPIELLELIKSKIPFDLKLSIKNLPLKDLQTLHKSLFNCILDVHNVRFFSHQMIMNYHEKTLEQRKAICRVFILYHYKPTLQEKTKNILNNFINYKKYMNTNFW